MESEHEQTVDCSDDELYDVKNRITTNHKGEKVWEPEGAKIAELYSQIEKDQVLTLKWTCPGRRPPSSHSDSTEERKIQIESLDIKDKSSESNQFDFDEDQPQNSTNFLKVAKRRSNQGKSRF